MSVKVMGMVWDLDLPQNEKFVLLAYADHAAHDGTSIFPAVATIAKKTGYKERSVQSITRKLTQKGMLISDGKGKKGTNKWRIPMGANITPPQSDAEGVQSTTERGAIATAPEPSVTVNEPSLDWNKLRQEAQERKDNKPDKSIVDAYVEAAQSEGMQKSNRYDAILSQIGVALNIYVDFKRWEQFIKFVDTRQQKHNESLDVFFRWLKEQKGFDISYWPPHKLVENWPRAFSQPEVVDKRHEL